jgi:hypothetical protein
MGEMRCAYRVWVGTPEGNKPLERSRLRQADNIKLFSISRFGA